MLTLPFVAIRYGFRSTLKAPKHLINKVSKLLRLLKVNDFSDIDNFLVLRYIAKDTIWREIFEDNKFCCFRGFYCSLED